MSTNKWHGGKGSQPRPVDPKKFSDNWDKIFKKHDNCGTPECCGECDTSTKGVQNEKTDV